MTIDVPVLFLAEEYSAGTAATGNAQYGDPTETTSYLDINCPAKSGSIYGGNFWTNQNSRSRRLSK